MANYLADSGLLIRHLRGRKPTVQLLRGLGKMGRVAIASVTRLELHAGMAPDERYATQKLLSRFEVLDLDAAVADRAGGYIREARQRGRRMSVPDAIIAATAVQHGLSLATYNRADFEGIPGLSLMPVTDE